MICGPLNIEKGFVFYTLMKQKTCECLNPGLSDKLTLHTLCKFAFLRQALFGKIKTEKKLKYANIKN